MIQKRVFLYSIFPYIQTIFIKFFILDTFIDELIIEFLKRRVDFVVRKGVFLEEKNFEI